MCRTFLGRPGLEEAAPGTNGIDLLTPVVPRACLKCPHRPRPADERKGKGASRPDCLRRLERSRWLESRGQGGSGRTARAYKRVVCVRCGRLKAHHAKGLCRSCYDSEYRRSRAEAGL